MEWLTQFWETLSLSKILIGVGLFFISFGITVLAVGIVMIKIPADYFSSQYSPDFMVSKHWSLRWSVIILKNILGIIIVLIGIVLSLPGIPGQGFLTILLGLILLDIPGKRSLEARIIKQKSILANVNNLRAKYNKTPLLID